MWDPKQACDYLNIPYRVYAMDKNIGGYSELQHRYIHINQTKEKDLRVWAHEIAHTMIHFQDYQGAVSGDTEKNAVNEIEADTIAYIITTVLGLENTSYMEYLKAFMSRLPLGALSLDIQKLKKNAMLILQAGGYYG